MASLPLKLWWALPLPLIFSRLLAVPALPEPSLRGPPGSLSAWFIEEARPADAFAAMGWAFAGLAGLCTVAVFGRPGDACACGWPWAAWLRHGLGWLLVQVPRAGWAGSAAT